MNCAYDGLVSREEERAYGIVPKLLDICETRVTLLGKQVLEPGLDERRSDRLRGQAYELTLLINELKGREGGPMVQSPRGADDESG